MSIEFGTSFRKALFGTINAEWCAQKREDPRTRFKSKGQHLLYFPGA